MLDSLLNKTKMSAKLERFAKKRLYGKISANSLTLLGLLVGITSAVFIMLIAQFELSYYYNIAAVFILTFSFMFDILDGALARVSEPTKFGGVFDIMADRTVEICIIIAITYRDPTGMVWPSVFLLSMITLCITIFLLLGTVMDDIESINSEKVIVYSAGLTERAETYLFLILAVLIPWYQSVIFWVFSIGVLLTIIQRLIYAYTMLK